MNGERRFLAGIGLREIRNGRLNCNSADYETNKGKNANGTYVKKIRKDKGTFPYASGQWQKNNMKKFSESMGHKLSTVTAITSKEARSEGAPLENFDEDVFGFMVARKDEITKEQYGELTDFEKTLYKSEGKKGYKRDITVKRRANFMVSALQAISPARMVSEFSVRQTPATPIIYSKEVYASDMASSFVLDIDRVGLYHLGKNAGGYMDYLPDEEVKEKLKDALVSDTEAKLDDETKRKRIEDTLLGFQFMPTKTTMANNLEDMSANFIMMAEYSIGCSVFNNVFQEGVLKIDYLKDTVDAYERFRKSKIYIGVRSEAFRQQVKEKESEDDQAEYKWLKELIQDEFGNDERFVITSVSNAVDRYMKDRF